MGARFLAVIAALATISAYAQEPARPQVIDARDVQAAQEIPMPPDPPAGSGAWSLRVHTSGGFTGQ